MTSLLPALRATLAAGEPAILVTVTEAHGSTPREAGAAMLVTATGGEGTIGGGRLEFDAVARARAMIASGEAEARMDVPLGPRIGQCCGGRVVLSLDRLDDARLAQAEARDADERARRPLVLVFGAGHTGRALAAALAPLPVRVRVVDSRPDRLALLPEGVEAVAAAIPEAEIAVAPPGAAFVVMTHEHGLDFLLTGAALARADARYVGMIGSGTKRARLASLLGREGRGGDLAGLSCPIGGGRVRDKRPEIIAALCAAEIVGCLFCEQRERLNERLAEA